VKRRASVIPPIIVYQFLVTAPNAREVIYKISWGDARIKRL